MVSFDTREGIMKEWDGWVSYHRAGGEGSWPRDAFESLLDYFEEQGRLLSRTADSHGCYYTKEGTLEVCPTCPLHGIKPPPA